MLDNDLDLQHTNCSFIEKACVTFKIVKLCQTDKFPTSNCHGNKRFTCCSCEEWGIFSANLLFFICLRQTKILNASNCSCHIKRQEER